MKLFDFFKKHDHNFEERDRWPVGLDVDAVIRVCKECGHGRLVHEEPLEK